jgi:hypothetical protein
MDNKKRMMFILEEDYYFITIKILFILKALDCDVKPFEDFRKLGIVFEFIKTNSNFKFLHKLLKVGQQDLFDNEKAVKIFCDSKLDITILKRVLFFLEKQNIVELRKNDKNKSIDVLLIKNDAFNELLREDIFKEDLQKCDIIKHLIPRLKTLKIDSLQKKIFGYSEVEKWGN